MTVYRTIELQYGSGKMPVQIPTSAVVLDEMNVEEPAPISDPISVTREALRRPTDMPPISDLVGRGSRVVIAFPDRVKGGTHAMTHRRVTLNLLLDELNTARVRQRDITLVCAIGLHRKNHQRDYRNYLGDRLLARMQSMQLVNHDAEDMERIINLGRTDEGDVVEVNRTVLEADLAIVLGHTVGNPYGGFSGGYKTVCTGLTGWRSIRSHHVPATMHRLDFVPVSVHSRFRRQLSAIGTRIESAMKNPFFAVDAVLNSGSRQLSVAAGRINAVERATWPLATRWTDLVLHAEPFDCLVLGMPRNFHYGPGMGSNPILMLQAIAAWVIRTAGALGPDASVICASICDGWFNRVNFPASPEVYELFRHHRDPERLREHEDEVCTRPEYVRAYRAAFAYHPFHAFSMVNMGAIAHMRLATIHIVGAKRPEFAEGMGCLPADSFAAAMAAVRARLGREPRILAIPKLTQSAIHVRLASQSVRTA